MRTPSLQYFYLQKPMTSLIIISIISVVCWIGSGDFYTKGEPREASVAVSMIQDNEWILPKVYADEVAYKPPFTHWLMAVFSLPQGKVTPFTSRLPSAIAFVGLIVFSFVFFGKNLKSREAFLACLIMLTSFELHRAAMTSRVDMVLTFLIVLGLERLFRWEERKQLKGFPVLISIILGLATLTKGPVGIVLPLLVFGIYLLLLRYSFLKIVAKLLPLALASFILPLVWYILAYRIEGKEFLDLVYAENFGRFLGEKNLNINYDLGHNEPFWYYPATLIAGFIPWSILLVLSLFGLKYKFTSKKTCHCGLDPQSPDGLSSSFRGSRIKRGMTNFLVMPKIKLFSLVAAVVIVLFYFIPSSKRSVYMMPAYPFISLFIAQYVLYLTEYHVKISRLFGIIIGVIAGLVSVVVAFTVFIHWIEPVEIVRLFTSHQKTLTDVSATVQNLCPSLLNMTLLVFLVFTLCLLWKHFGKKNQIKILSAVITVYFGLFLVIDGVFLPAFKDGVSVKPFAEHLSENYPINENNLFVLNNLREYSNMYGLNFYLNNRFHNFEKEQVPKGFFLVDANVFEKIVQKYGGKYQFRLLEEYQNKNRDGGKVIQFYYFRKKR